MNWGRSKTCPSFRLCFSSPDGIPIVHPRSGEGQSFGYRIATGLTGEPVPPTTRNGFTVSMNS